MKRRRTTHACHNAPRYTNPPHGALRQASTFLASEYPDAQAHPTRRGDASRPYALFVTAHGASVWLFRSALHLLHRVMHAHTLAVYLVLKGMATLTLNFLRHRCWVLQCRPRPFALNTENACQEHTLASMRPDTQAHRTGALRQAPTLVAMRIRLMAQKPFECETQGGFGCHCGRTACCQ